MTEITAGAHTPAPSGRDERLARISGVTRVLQRPELGALIGAIFVFVLFAVTDASANHLWLTQTGLAAWSEQAAFFGIMAVPVGLLMIAGEFDLSAGVMTGVTAIVMGLIINNWHWNAWLAILGTVVFAVIVGLVNGVVVVTTKLPSFIVTLATFFILRGVSVGGVLLMNHGSTQVTLASDWPHPSFAGRFLPLERQVGETGFTARWLLNALATTAPQAAAFGGPACSLSDGGDDVPAGDARRRPCVETFGVAFMDPVSPYVLSDRATKYGLLFIALTFVGVGALEVLRRLRVHPIQYLLVGSALAIFFLLLVSLSEHVPFAVAYLAAAAACTALLTFYGAFVLRGSRAGAAFGAAIGGLFGALYALLQLEQTALLLGSILLFAVLAAVMVATRRIDWYGFFARMRGEGAEAPAKAAPAAAT